MMRRLSNVLVLLTVIVLAGCQSCPQAGTYTGFEGKLGIAKLKVKADGTVTYRYGPGGSTGIWVAVSNSIIKATFTHMKISPEQGIEGTEEVVRYYHLDAKAGRFIWDGTMEQLLKRTKENSSE